MIDDAKHSMVGRSLGDRFGVANSRSRPVLMALFYTLRADALHLAGIKLRDAGDDDGAIEKYREALALDPQRASTLYNLGLVYKYRRAWRESFDYNQAANNLRAGDEATLWNLAIAATALRDWHTAREVWRELKIIPESGEGPIEANFGLTPVRLNADRMTDAPGEVVWARRLCPVRARIENIPTGKTGYRYADVVLHDGAGVGTRLNADGQERDVFNVLELFEPSDFSTFEATVQVESPDHVEVLQHLCDETSISVEDWTASLRSLCKACSEGRPHEGHDQELPAAVSWNKSRTMGFAAESYDRLWAVVDAWIRQTGSRVSDLECTLEAQAR